MPVDLYVGGAEHAVLHLLYARFWHKVLYDLKLVSTPEPFQKLVNQGLILGEDNEKMSKSRGNVVNPDDVIAGHGADAFRLYEMFMGPLESVKPWNTRSIEGVDRFLNRVWRFIVSEEKLNPRLQDVAVEGELKRLLHATIKSVTEDIEALRFNTAISAMMILLNALEDADPLPRSSIEPFVLLLSPFAPHIAEELWERLGHRESLAYAPWPIHDPQALVQAEILWIVQVNGKVRARLTLPAAATDSQLRESVLSDAQVKKFLNGQTVKQFIVVPNRLVNIVV
jgi:leucyl-tRNA synthetase